MKTEGKLINNLFPTASLGAINIQNEIDIVAE